MSTARKACGVWPRTRWGPQRVEGTKQVEGSGTGPLILSPATCTTKGAPVDVIRHRVFVCSFPEHAASRQQRRKLERRQSQDEHGVDEDLCFDSPTGCTQNSDRPPTCAVSNEERHSTDETKPKHRIACYSKIWSDYGSKRVRP